MMLAVLVLIELVLLVTLLNRISTIQQEVRDAVEVHRCRNEAVHREILESLHLTYPLPEVAPDCTANARYREEMGGRVR